MTDQRNKCCKEKYPSGKARLSNILTMGWHERNGFCNQECFYDYMLRTQIKTSIEIMMIKANLDTKKRKITEAKLKKMKDEEIQKGGRNENG